jgi:hypothetical protein
VVVVVVVDAAAAVVVVALLLPVVLAHVVACQAACQEEVVFHEVEILAFHEVAFLAACQEREHHVEEILVVVAFQAAWLRACPAVVVCPPLSPVASVACLWAASAAASVVVCLVEEMGQRGAQTKLWGCFRRPALRRDGRRYAISL